MRKEHLLLLTVLLFFTDWSRKKLSEKDEHNLMAMREFLSRSSIRMGKWWGRAFFRNKENIQDMRTAHHSSRRFQNFAQPQKLEKSLFNTIHFAQSIEKLIPFDNNKISLNKLYIDNLLFQLYDQLNLEK